MPRRDVQPQPIRVDWHIIEEASCLRKQQLSERVARLITAHDVTLHPYRCHFDPSHWHVGHTPNMKTLRKLAYAIRARANDPTISL